MRLTAKCHLQRFDAGGSRRRAWRTVVQQALSGPPNGIGSIEITGGDIIERRRILNALADATAYPIAVVAAPAGFGKSTAIRQYLDASQASWIRYGVTFEGVSLAGFVRGFIDSLLPVAPGLQMVYDSAHANVNAPPVEWLVASIREHLQGYSGYIHIDDLHFTGADSDVEKFLMMLLDAAPSNIRWILAARRASRFPIASWTAYNRLRSVIDERMLRFTEEEAQECARRLIGAEGEQAAREAYRLTGGWPAGFVLAVRANRMTPSVSAVESNAGSREMIYEYLAQQVFQNLTERQQQFLFDICHYKAIEFDLLLEEWEDAQALVDDLRRYVPFLHVESHAVLHCDGLFADFLQSRLSLRGKAAVRASSVKGAKRLERGARISEALVLYIRAGARQEIRELLVRNGMALLDSGRSDIVQAALDAESDRAEQQPTALLLLRAVLASKSADFARCDALFERAVEAAADDSERLAAHYRYALELIRRNRSVDRVRLEKVIDALIRATSAKALVADGDALMMGTIATGCAITGRLAEAKDYAEQALQLANRSDSTPVRATLYHQASFVAYAAGESQQAMALSSKAIDLAKLHDLYALAARCHSVRYSIWLGFGYDTAKALAELERMIECAEKAGDVFLAASALAGTYALRTEFGEGDDLDELRSRILEHPGHGELSSSAMASADAMRAAWLGRFRGALDCVWGTAQSQISDGRRGLRWAEIALYASACGQREDADEAISHALALTQRGLRGRSDERRRFAFAHAYCTLACIIMHQLPRANAILSPVEQVGRDLGSVERAVMKASRAAYLHVEAGESMEPAVSLLRESRLGGIANLLTALPMPGLESAVSALSALTKTEVTILREIARGSTNAKIARDLGRSTYTVNAHVASILRKLHCRTRQDAAECARAHGI